MLIVTKFVRYWKMIITSLAATSHSRQGPKGRNYPVLPFLRGREKNGSLRKQITSRHPPGPSPPPHPWKPPPPSWDFQLKTELPPPGASDSPFPLPEQKKKNPKRPPSKFLKSLESLNSPKSLENGKMLSEKTPFYDVLLICRMFLSLCLSLELELPTHLPFLVSRPEWSGQWS